MSIDIATIDLVSSHIHIFVGNVNKAGQIMPKAYDSIACDGLRRGLIVDPQAVSASLYKAVVRLKKEHGIEIQSAFVNVPCEVCTHKNNTYEERIAYKTIDADYLDRVKNALLSIRMPNGYVVADLAGTRFVLDRNLELRDPIGKKADHFFADTNVIGVESNYIQSLQTVFDQAGLALDGIVVNTIAGLSLLPSSDAERSNIVMIHVSWEVTDLTVCQCGRIVFMDSIPAGVANFAKDVSIGLNISKEEATKILSKTPIAESNYIKNDYETVTKTVDGETTHFLLSDVIRFVKERTCDLFRIAGEHLEEEGIAYKKQYILCIYGADFETYAGYHDVASQFFDVKIKKIPYALFEVNDIRYGSCAGMVRYISNHALLKKQSDVFVQNRTTLKKKSGFFDKINRLLKMD